MPISPEKLKDIQKRLDEKLINPKDLNSKQKVALDNALKSGQLKGYKKGVSEMFAERHLARTEVAKTVRAKLAPLTPTSMFSLGVKRGTMVAAGDIIGSFAPYIMDSKKLSLEARTMALQGKPVSYAPKITHANAKNAFKGVSNLLSKVPILRNFKSLGRALDGFMSLIGRGGKLTASQALRTELKSQMYGALGAGTGSVAYDAVNFPAKFAAAAGEDLSGIDQNKYAQMSPVGRTTYHAIDNARTALLWNAGAFGLFGTFRGLFHGAKNLLKLDPLHQRKINELIVDQGIPLNITQLAEGTGGGSGLIKAMNKLIGVLPLGAGVPKAQQARFFGAAILAGQSNLRQATNVPLLHVEVLANALNTTIGKTYEQSGAIYGAMYKSQEDKMNAIANVFEDYVSQIAAKHGQIIGKPVGTKALATGREEIITNMGIKGGMDIPFIHTENLKKVTNDMIGVLDKATTPGAQIRMGKMGLKSTDLDPMNNYIREIQFRLREFRLANGGDYVTPAQFHQMRREWNANYVNTAMKSGQDVSMKANMILEAMEKDLNQVVKMPGNTSLLAKNAKLAQWHTGIKNELGPEKADEFLKKFQDQVRRSNLDFEDANQIFGQSVNFYANNALSKIVRQMDTNALTAKQMLNIGGKNNITNVRAMNQLFKAAFDPKHGNSDGVEQLYKLLGGDTYFSAADKKRAAYTMNLLMYRKFFDAFNQNAVVRQTQGVKEMIAPFTTEGADLATTINILNKESPAFRDTTEKLIDNYYKSGRGSGKFIDKVRFEKAAIDVDLLRKSIEEGLPLEQRILMQKETAIARKTMQPVKAVTDQDVVKLTEIATKGTKAGKIIPEIERVAAVRELDQMKLRLGSYEGFQFGNFKSALGLGTDTGRAQLIKGFTLGKGMAKETASKHVDNLETIIEALERNANAPIGDSSTFILRRVILGLGLGGTVGLGLMFGGPGLLSAAMGAIMIRGGAHFFNSPALAKKWLDLYTVGERLNINSIQALSPTRQAVFADIFNYAFADDPDRPIVKPGNISEEKIIKYLQDQETVQTVPTADGLYNTVPDEVKMRFDPDLRKLKNLNESQYVEVEGFNNGMRIANERTDLLHEAESNPQMAQAITPQASQFLENPQRDMAVPPGATAGMNMAQGITPSPQTANMYKAMFPGDSLGAAIAEKRAAGERLPYKT